MTAISKEQSLLVDLFTSHGGGVNLRTLDTVELTKTRQVGIDRLVLLFIYIPLASNHRQFDRDHECKLLYVVYDNYHGYRDGFSCVEVYDRFV